VLVVAQTRLDGLAEAFRAGLAELRTAYARERPLRVFYQIWNRPLYTLGGQQIISEAIEVCGGQNIFADLTLAAP
ncbi:cobalamin-binding protein, partial [Stutzerimonas stutzeri]|nr:cobalamin-binding protein [Stutzerimonas stutzeri]